MAKPVLYRSMSPFVPARGTPPEPQSGWVHYADRIELEPTRVLDAPSVTHVRYRVAS